MSDLVGDPEDRFSHNEAHFVSMPGVLQMMQTRIQSLLAAMDRYCNSYNLSARNWGLVVQSNVSLTRLLSSQLLLTKLSNTLLFFLKKI